MCTRRKADVRACVDNQEPPGYESGHDVEQKVELLSDVQAVETIASGTSVRVRQLLTEEYGAGNWRKCKGVATVRLADGFVGRAEVHWYEAHGRGRVDMKIKRMLE